ncbi:MAG: DUF4384 domain-containing protein [Gammaproteobacteria bacterium]|nr:DUF4384 domain-containing protein [Gammaproteobacteria bacterium]MDH5799890.1 DUF4384 domain-containing protein [Gammaproteobacteria bacterium]
MKPFWRILLISLVLNSHTGASAEFKLSVTTHLGDRQTFRQGDTIAFLVSLHQDAYLHVIYEDAAGDLTLVLPNQQQAETFYKAAQFISVPAADAGFEFSVGPPYGKETLWVIACDKPLDLNRLVALTAVENGMHLLKNTKIEQLKKKLYAYASEHNLRLDTAAGSIHTLP